MLRPRKPLPCIGGKSRPIINPPRLELQAKMRTFRTWVLTTEPILEPPELLRKECEKTGLGEDEFLVPGLGETVPF